jgi:molecular chaperone GrpE
MTDTESHTAGAPQTQSTSDDGEAQASPAVENPAAEGTPPTAEVEYEQPLDCQDAEIDGEIDGEAVEIKGELDELVSTTAQRDEYLALAQRTQADFENYRKRVARDAVAAQDRGVVKLARELLPALDNLDRAIEAATQESAPHQGGHPEGAKQVGEDEDPLLAGVRLVRSELAAALARLRIEAFAPLGEVFDPNLHDAVAQQPVEGATSGTVAEVFQSGYRMGETIIRPARVLVAA